MAVKTKPKGNANKPPAGTTNGGGAEGEEEEEEEDPEDAPVTKRELNQAISKSIGQFTRKKLPDLFKGAITEAFAAAGLGPKKDEDDGEGDQGDDAANGDQGDQGGAAAPAGKGGKGTPAAAAQQRPAPTASDRKLNKVQKELDELKARETANARKLQQEEQRRVLTEQFTAQGVRKESVAPLIAYMTSEEGNMVRRDATGKLVFVQGAGTDDEEELPLKDGLVGYFKSDEGKAHIAPRNAGGSGFRPGAQQQNGARQPQGNGAVASRQQADNDLMAAVSGALGAVVDIE